MRHGVLNDVLNIMSAMGKCFDTFERLCVLTFDKMKVKECLEYDPATDEVLGPYRKVQVVMVWGLCAKWEQPIYIAFNQPITKANFIDILKKLYDIGFLVLCCTCDGGSENVRLFNELGTDYENPTFKHPLMNYFVVCMLDIPHTVNIISLSISSKLYKFPPPQTTTA